MKKTFHCAIICIAATCLSSGNLYAQSVETQQELAEDTGNHWSLSASASVLSAYEWRGYMPGGFSLQPEATIGYSFPSIELYADIWYDHSFADGFASFPKEKSILDSYNELDLTLGLDWKGLEFSLASYFTPLYGFNPEDGESTTFAFDATLGYTFDFGLGLHWSTLLSEPVEEGEKKPFSSYCELSYEGSAGPVDIGVKAGLVPWYSPYIDYIDENDARQVSMAEKAHFTKLALELGHTFTFNDDRFSIPVGLNVLYNPTTTQWGLQLTAGFSFDTTF